MQGSWGTPKLSTERGKRCACAYMPANALRFSNFNSYPDTPPFEIMDPPLLQVPRVNPGILKWEGGNCSVGQLDTAHAHATVSPYLCSLGVPQKYSDS